ncbi:MAG: transglutaminase domain-containing protein [Planctomycetota bacterium]
MTCDHWTLATMRGVVIGLTLGFLAGVMGCATMPAEVRQALAKAGDNRPELEKVLAHYRQTGDEQKLAAAEFLIANMPGHGYTVAVLKDADGNEIAYEALDYENFKEALAVLEAIEQEHGEADFKRKRFDQDIDLITAELLIENIDLAFQAWREKPWARELTFEAFCEHVLPYRGSNEPLNSTRPACLERYADLNAKLKNPADPREAAGLIQRDVGGWIGFNEIYYLHPTDQSFEEMNERGLGRCEDITNMQMYAMRANGIAAAADYTPFWANRDNNHAWQVILDTEGRGKAGLNNRAAKIYRKMFSMQRDSLGCRKHEDEEVPRWLAGQNYIDVTDQYMETTDVTLSLVNPVPAGARFAYICVFNGGEWQAIHWGEIDDNRVTFTNMGGNIAYLPAYFVDEKLEPAAPAFVLTKDGQVRQLLPDEQRPLTIELTATTPETPDADTAIERPMIVVKPGKPYELFVWEDGWQSLGKQTAGDEPVEFTNIPGGGLYWLVAEGSRRLERIFTIESGRQIWW